VTITAWPYGSSAPQRVATVTTGSGGRWSFSVAPKIQTAYSAAWGSMTSPRRTAGVMPLLSLRELSDGNVWTQVQAGRSFAGKQVKLQQHTAGGGWKTVMQMKLNAQSTVVFPLLLPTSTIRVAMSVNEAGPGFLGATSHILGYHAT
jgi:hypothetical protein